MADLFGIDIAGTLNDAMEEAGGLLDGTLTRTTPGTRTGGSLTAGTNPTTTTHTFKGFVETKEKRRPDQVGSRGTAVVTILGASLSPATTPRVNDTATIDGSTYTLLELLSRDPASAVYEFRTED